MFHTFPVIGDVTTNCGTSLNVNNELVPDTASSADTTRIFELLLMPVIGSFIIHSYVFVPFTIFTASNVVIFF